jgi:hypothetical protein
MDPQLQWLRRLDAAISAGVGIVLVVGLMAFGGAVWWARPALLLVTLATLALLLGRFAVAGHCGVVKSPILAIGLLMVALGIAQLVPLPAPIALRLAARARSVHTMGLLPDRVLEDDPSAVLVDPGGRRTPATVDRNATLRWIAAAGCCLAVLSIVLHHASRLDRTVLVVGSIVGVLFLATPIGLVQWAILGSSEVRLFRILGPGANPAWGPTAEDALAVPGSTLLRPLAPGVEPSSADAWLVSRVTPGDDRRGSLLGGPGGYLALAALALPLAMALVLHVIAPRGSRLALRERLRHSEHGGLAAVLLILTTASAFLAGRIATPWAWGPIALGILVAGLPSMRSGLRLAAPALTLLVLAAFASGAAVGGSQRAPWVEVQPAVWRDAVRIARSFPALGAGLGSFATVEPYFKGTDAAATSAGSSILQWWAEAGVAGLALLALAVLACLARLPGALRRLGRADGPLAFGLLGGIGGFAMYSATHWGVELLGVALAASAVLGLFERWLAGGTDLFVEPASPGI